MRHKRLDLKLIFIGVIVHLIVLYSIFDIYFKSPLVLGSKSIGKLYENAPAKRLVLFVADGLRADSFFNTYNREKDLYFR